MVFLKRFLSLSLFLAVPVAFAQSPSDFFAPWVKPQPLGLNRMLDLRDFGDLMRDRDDATGLMNDPILTAVTRDFGPTVITIRQFPYRSGMVVADPKPWSSWWYPKKEEFLFKNGDSRNLAPLVKYDMLRKIRFALEGRNPPASAAEYEKNNYNENVAPWEGLCDAWGLASISKLEPKRPVAIRAGNSTITFSVADLKALLLKTYEAVDDSALKYYGQKFTGDYNGWIFPDVFPDQFHRFLEVQLFGKKEPFVMDHDPGLEVWNVPVYKANYMMTSMPNEPNSVFVRAWLYSAESTQSHQKDYVGTIEVVREYNYVLQGTRNAMGDLVISSGYWVKNPDGGVDSRRDHPDFLSFIPDHSKVVQKSWNPEIDVNLVNEILRSSY